MTESLFAHVFFFVVFLSELKRSNFYSLLAEQKANEVKSTGMDTSDIQVQVGASDPVFGAGSCWVPGRKLENKNRARAKRGHVL